MKSESPPADNSGDLTVLRPYHGSRVVGRGRFRKILFWPGLVIFCLLYGMSFALFMPFLVVVIAIPIAVMAFLVIWALPEARTAPTAPLVFLFFAFFVSLVLWPTYLGLTLPSLPWITPLRITGIPMALCLLVCVSSSADFRSKVATALQQTPWLWKLFVAFVAVQIMTIGASSQLLATAQKVVLYQISWTAIFFVSCYVFLKPGRVERWAAIMCLMTIPVGLIAFWEFKHEVLPWVGHIPSFLTIQDPTVVKELVPKERSGASFRAQSTFDTPLNMAEYIALTVPFVYHFAVQRYPILVRLGAMALIPFMFAIGRTTDSRLAMVGFGLATSLYLLFFGVLQWRRSPNNLIGPAIVLTYPVMAVAAVASTFLVGRVRNRIWGSGTTYEVSSQGRLQMYKDGIPLIFHRPWGYGADQAAVTLGFTNQNGTLTIDTYWIAIALDYGIIGFIFYYGTVIAGIYYASRYGIEYDQSKDRDISFLGPIAISLATFLVIKSVLSEPQNHPLVFMMMGAVAALVYRVRSDRVGAREKHDNLKAPQSPPLKAARRGGRATAQRSASRT
jgi:O-Antigen ligase